MAIQRHTICQEYWFNHALSLSATPGPGGWCVKDTSSAGTPTYLTGNSDGGELVITLANTNEAEIVTLYQNDLLYLPVGAGKLQRVGWLAKVGGVDAVTVVTLGAASAAVHTGNAEDDVTTSAWFKIEGSASTSAVVLETDDNTTDNNDKSSGGLALSSTYKWLEIDFELGLSDVRFFADGARVGGGTKFSMAALASNTRWQPFVQIEKASGTGTPSVSIARFRAIYNVALGA